MADTTRYVVNLDFDGGDLGEVIEASPKVVADWLDAGFISEIDDNGNRLVAIAGRKRAVIDEGAEPVPVPGDVRHVDKGDVTPPE